MKDKKVLLQEIKEEKLKSECIDSRDFGRLCSFLTFEEAKNANMLSDEATGDGWGEVEEYTKENIVKQLKSDLAFGFEKALDCRGISSGLMYNVVKMWLYILEDELQDFNEYSMYGLPLFKAVALKYGFDNPIGEDSGSEDKYEESIK